MAISYPISSILEKQLEWYIVGQFDALFPGWKIYDPPESPINPAKGNWPAGVQYPIGRRRKIDILCIDPQGDFVVIEIKRGRAPDKPPEDVVTQIEGYMAWVKVKLAVPEQRVKGLIIAKSFSPEMRRMLSNKSEINIWTYNWELHFDEHSRPEL